MAEKHVERDSLSLACFCVVFAAGQLSPFLGRILREVVVGGPSLAEYLPGASLLLILNCAPFGVAGLIGACRALPLSVRLTVGFVPAAVSVFAHATVDLLADAQAGLQVVIIPIVLFLFVFLIFVAGLVAETLLRLIGEALRRRGLGQLNGAAKKTNETNEDTQSFGLGKGDDWEKGISPIIDRLEDME